MGTGGRGTMISENRPVGVPALCNGCGEPVTQEGVDDSFLCVACGIQYPRWDDLTSTSEKLYAALKEAEQKAWDNLSRYKFMMFGYWASLWVHLNRLGGFGYASPFKDVVQIARKHLVEVIDLAKPGDPDDDGRIVTSRDLSAWREGAKGWRPAREV